MATDNIFGANKEETAMVEEVKGQSQIPAPVVEHLIRSEGVCDPNRGKIVANPNFSFQDIYLLTTGITGMPELNPEGFNILHMSNVHTGNTFENLRGQICFNDQKPKANRKIADWLDNNCVETIKGDATGAALTEVEKKCDELHGVVDFYAEPDTADALVKAGLYSLMGLVGVWLVFMPGGSLWRAIAKAWTGRGGGGGGDGTTGTGGSGRNAIEEASGGIVKEIATVKAPAVELEPAPVAEPAAEMSAVRIGDVRAVTEPAGVTVKTEELVLEDAFAMLETPEMMADLRGMVVARVVDTPKGMVLREGQVALLAKGRYFAADVKHINVAAPVGATITIPSVGSIVRVNAVRLVPVRMVASPVR